MISEKRKIYFDIDANQSKKEVHICLRQLISSILNEIHLLNGDIGVAKDIIVLSASNDIKQSYHLILPHHICNRLVDLKHFTTRVVNNIDDRYKVMIDMGVYRKNQSMRMYGCMKRTAIDRVLYPMTEMMWENDKFDPIVDMWMDDDGFWNDNNEYKKERYPEIKVLNPKTGEINVITAEQRWQTVIEMRRFTKSLITFHERDPKFVVHYPDIEDNQKSPSKVHSEDPFHFDVPAGLEFEKVVEYPDKYLVLYKNKDGYHCPTCDREHKQENPYISMNKQTKQPYFECRRGKK